MTNERIRELDFSLQDMYREIEACVESDTKDVDLSSRKDSSPGVDSGAGPHEAKSESISFTLLISRA